MSSLSEKLIKFFNTYTLNDLYAFMDNFDIVTFVSDWRVITIIIIAAALLLIPNTKTAAAILFKYSIIFVFLFVFIVVWKNSTMSAKESFVFFGGSLLSVSGFCVYKYLIK